MRGGREGAGVEVAMISRSMSNSSISANIVQEGFLQHTMVKDVLELYPVAASIVDHRTGKLPLVLAIEHGKSWETAVGPLLEAYSAPYGGGGDGGMVSFTSFCVATGKYIMPNFRSYILSFLRTIGTAG